MASIVDNKIGGVAARSFPDYIFNGQAVPQNTAVTSDAVLLGKTQNALEVVVEAAEAIVLGASAVLTVEYLYGDSYASSEVLYTVTAEIGGSTIAAGELARFVPPSGSLPSYAKIKITTDDAAATGSLTVFASLISR